MFSAVPTFPIKLLLTGPHLPETPLDGTLQSHRAWQHLGSDPSSMLCQVLAGRFHRFLLLDHKFLAVLFITPPHTWFVPGKQCVVSKCLVICI